MSSGNNGSVALGIKDAVIAGGNSTSSSSGGTRKGGKAVSNTGSGNIVQNLINNSRSSAPARDSTPLLGGGSGDLPNHSSAGGHGGGDDGLSGGGAPLHLKGVAWLLGVAVVVAAALFGLLALRRSHAVDSVPFSHVTHPLQPTALWGAVRRPYPTGAWWTNLVLNKGDNNVAVLPYAIKATDDNGLQISYSYFRHLSTKMVQADLFAPDMAMAAVENTGTHYIESYDPLSVGLVFPTVNHLQHNRPSYYRTHLVRGCPYLTVEYYGCHPLVTAANMITVINGLQYREEATFQAPALTGSVFEITVISGQQWMLFAEPAITFRWTKDGKLTSISSYTGFLRIAVAPVEGIKPVLVEHWRAYPTGGDVSLDYPGGGRGGEGGGERGGERGGEEGGSLSEGDMMVTYQWRRKGEGRLLMLALPHHVEILQDATLVGNATGVYVTLKGGMTAVLGDRWYMKEGLPVPVDVGKKGQKGEWTGDGGGGFEFRAPRGVGNEGQKKVIREAVMSDLAAIRKGDFKRWNKTDVNDPYWEGKRMAMYARLAVIADEVGMVPEREEAVALAAAVMTPWLGGTNDNPFLYDTTWGGIILQSGLSNPYVNFGNTYYNDHHFQYGYFCYCAAVLARFDPEFVRKHKRALTALVADIANDDDASPSFPLARHKDFFDGHSWASGLFEQNNGKSQESSSEAINAYYGAHLYGRATGDKKLESFAKLLLAMELRSTRWYWHMRNDSKVYDAVFAANRMVGVVGGLDATCHTWFGESLEYVHGINLMPFTPITEALLDVGYVKEEYAVLSPVLTRQEEPVAEEWKGFVYLDHAVLDPASAWEEVQMLDKFDSGNSLSNSLWWVATRPGAGEVGKGEEGGK
ncbi:hypothetical protein VYU27_000018 [Nannochloropsis oceanica]